MPGAWRDPEGQAPEGGFWLMPERLFPERPVADREVGQRQYS